MFSIRTISADAPTRIPVPTLEKVFELILVVPTSVPRFWITAQSVPPLHILEKVFSTIVLFALKAIAHPDILVKVFCPI